MARPNVLASDGETLFLSVFDQSRIVAINATTGKRLWSFQTGGWIGGMAVASATHVFIGSQDQFFYCLDKKTGKQVWKFETKWRIESGGVVDETFVYFGSCDGGLYCLNQSDGKLRWRFATDLGPDGRRRGSVYFAAAEGQLYAVDRDKGTLNNKVRPSEHSEMYCSPATDGTHFFLVTQPHLKGRGESSLVAIGFK